MTVPLADSVKISWPSPPTMIAFAPATVTSSHGLSRSGGTRHIGAVDDNIGTANDSESFVVEPCSYDSMTLQRNPSP